MSRRDAFLLAFAAVAVALGVLALAAGMDWFGPGPVVGVP